MNLLVAVLVGIMASLLLSPDYLTFYLVLLPIMFVFTFGILFYSVVRMRKTIKSIAYAFPNERLMIIHFINFPFWSALVVTDTVLAILLI